MHHWRTSLKSWMEVDLKCGLLELALSHLDAMKACWSPQDLHGCLSSHTLKGIPTLHYLASFCFREEDLFHLDKLIRIFTDFGYDINKSSDSYCGRRINGRGTNALMASIDQQNLILMECLLRHGARMDIRAENCLSACQLAVNLGDLRCLEKLVQFGGPSVLATTEKGGEGYVPPLLHMAVDKGHTEIVNYLLRKWEEFGLDVNEKAFYKNDVLTPTLVESLTPLEWAIRRRNIPIVLLLLKQPAIKLSDFKELHFCLQEGDAEVALLLLDFCSPERLVSEKIGDIPALHCLHPKAFYQDSRVEFTKKLILEYVRRGWDVNSVSASTITKTTFMRNVWLELVNLTGCTLLHLACLHKGQLEVIKMLVEAGADINCKTEGDLEFYPLHISLTMQQWQTVAYLIEKGADLGVRGSFKESIPLTRVIRKNLSPGNLEPNSSLNAVELLVAVGCDKGLPLLDKVLAMPDVVWHGANEFHLAIEGCNPVYICKVVQHCARSISKEDLSWITIGDAREKVPTLVYLLSRPRMHLVNVPALAELINLMVSLGYDLNLSCPGGHSVTGRDRILSNILATDAFHEGSSNLLLRTVLQVDHFRLNLPVTQENCRNPIVLVLLIWPRHCNIYKGYCWRNKLPPHSSEETIKLLITHGLDVTGMVIGSYFIYHFGYNEILKMLYCAGAKISEEFFTSPEICNPDHPETQPFLQEISEVKKWTEEFDRKEGRSLKHLCRLRVRKMLKCVGDLKMLDGIPEKLKDYVLCKSHFYAFLITQCELYSLK